MPVNERYAHIKILRHSDHCIIDRCIAVGVIFTEAIADDTGTLAVRLVRRKRKLHHGVEYSALYGL